MYAVKATGTLRVSEEGELKGLDLHEHGGFAYPEIMSPWGSPGGTLASGKPGEYGLARGAALLETASKQG